MAFLPGFYLYEEILELYTDEAGAEVLFEGGGFWQRNEYILLCSRKYSAVNCGRLGFLKIGTAISPSHSLSRNLLLPPQEVKCTSPYTCIGQAFKIALNKNVPEMMFYDVWGHVIIYCVFHFVPSVILDLGYFSLSVKSTSLKLLWWEQSSHLQRERERPRDSQASSNCCRSLLFQCLSPPGHRRYSALGPPRWVLPGFLTQKLWNHKI